MVTWSFYTKNEEKLFFLIDGIALFLETIVEWLDIEKTPTLTVFHVICHD